MKIGSAFSSTYLKASDVPEDRAIKLQIDRVDQENVSGGRGKDEEVKPVLYFIGKTKGMVLNKTNAKVITKAYGDETDDWHGKVIELYQTEVEFQGDMVAALRIRAPKTAASSNGGGGQAAPVRAAAAPVASRRAEIQNREPVEEEPAFADDDIPF